MLYIIGLGLSDENDLTLRAISAAKKCDCYAELYTSKWGGSVDGLSKVIGRPITVLKRQDLEDNLQHFLAKAKQADIALFVPGDPLAATTHIDVFLEAKKKRIPVQIIHNASIFSAVAETGLQLYKFGRTATVPFSGQLEAVKEALKGNRKLGLHTLLLLDLDHEVGLYMRAMDAVKMLLKAKILKEKEKLVAASRLGSSDSEIVYRTAKELLEEKLGVPAVLIVPGKLHFREKEALEGP